MGDSRRLQAPAEVRLNAQRLRQPALQAGGGVARGVQGGPQPVMAVDHFGPGHHAFYFLKHDALDHHGQRLPGHVFFLYEDSAPPFPSLRFLCKSK